MLQETVYQKDLKERVTLSDSSEFVHVCGCLNARYSTSLPAAGDVLLLDSRGSANSQLHNRLAAILVLVPAVVLHGCKSLALKCHNMLSNSSWFIRSSMHWILRWRDHICGVKLNREMWAGGKPSDRFRIHWRHSSL